jgi:hypothetical protein
MQTQLAGRADTLAVVLLDGSFQQGWLDHQQQLLVQAFRLLLGSQPGAGPFSDHRADSIGLHLPGHPCGRQRRRQVMCVNGPAAHKNQSVLDRVAKLTHVPVPRQPLEFRNRLGGNRYWRQAGLVRQHGQEMLGQRLDVLPAVPKRGKLDRKGNEPEIQIVPELGLAAL